MALSNTAVPKYYGMFRDAVIRGEIPVCREIDLEMNRIDRLIDDPRYYYDDQSKLLLSNLMQLGENQIKYKVAIILTIFTGFRLGELMGLEWDDINFNDGIVSVNRSSQYLADKGVFTKTPKTESSIRDIAIPEFVISLLEE